MEADKVLDSLLEDPEFKEIFLRKIVQMDRGLIRVQ